MTTLSDTCFVVAPIGRRESKEFRRFKDLLDVVIRPTVEASGYGLTVIRADDISGPGSLIRDILEHVAGSYIVIADLTGQNANVFYELGVRHSLSPRTILMAESIDDVPFDLRDYRVIIYDQASPSGIEALKGSLRTYLNEIYRAPRKPDNPVLDRLGEDQIVRSPSSSLASKLRVPLDIRYSGLQRVYKSFPERDVQRAILTAQAEVDILTTWVNQAIILGPALSEAERRGVRIRILVLDPCSEAARQRGADIGYSEGHHVPDAIRRCVTELLSCAKAKTDPFGIRVYSHYPTFLMYRMDDVLLYSTHLRGQVTMRGPQMEVRGRRALLFRLLIDQFELSYAEARPYRPD